MQRIRLERKKRNLTLQAVSESTGINKSDLSRVERGFYRIHPAWKLKLSRFYNVSSQELFND